MSELADRLEQRRRTASLDDQKDRIAAAARIRNMEAAGNELYDAAMSVMGLIDGPYPWDLSFAMDEWIKARG